jgi:hypothetical protein
MLDISEDAKNNEYFKNIFVQFMGITVKRHARVTVSYIDEHRFFIMDAGLDGTSNNNNMISLECPHKLLSATKEMANKDRKKPNYFGRPNSRQIRGELLSSGRFSEAPFINRRQPENNILAAAMS